MKKRTIYDTSWHPNFIECKFITPNPSGDKGALELTSSISDDQITMVFSDPHQLSQWADELRAIAVDWQDNLGA